jgi:DNA polymerase III subunit delta'
MAFKDFPGHEQGVELLQRSIERGRLAHGYLFSGSQLESLELLARNLAKTLNCQQPVHKNGVPVDCCDQCVNCRKVDHGNHADVHWVRPESKLRVILIDQIRELAREIQLKPTEAEYKVAVIAGADRLKVEAANAFLKTLEEPPAKSIFVLLTTEPQRILETIFSRCLRLNFGVGAGPRIASEQREWIAKFSSAAVREQKSLFGRYRLLDLLVQQLGQLRSGIEGKLTASSPLEQYPEAEKDLRERWEDELKAAIEAEYRRQRQDWIALLQWWLRDIWLTKVQGSEQGPLKIFPELPATDEIARRISSSEAVNNLELLEQLQSRLHTNVQEALAVEVTLLKLRL